MEFPTWPAHFDLPHLLGEASRIPGSGVVTRQLDQSAHVKFNTCEFLHAPRELGQVVLSCVATAGDEFFHEVPVFSQPGIVIIAQVYGLRRTSRIAVRNVFGAQEILASFINTMIQLVDTKGSKGQGNDHSQEQQSNRGGQSSEAWFTAAPAPQPRDLAEG